MNALKSIALTVLSGPLQGKHAEGTSYSDASELLAHVAASSPGETCTVGFDVTWDGDYTYAGQCKVNAENASSGYHLGEHIRKFISTATTPKNKGMVTLDATTHRRFRAILLECALSDPSPAAAVVIDQPVRQELDAGTARLKRFLNLPPMPEGSAQPSGPFFWETETAPVTHLFAQSAPKEQQ